MNLRDAISDAFNGTGHYNSTYSAEGFCDLGELEYQVSQEAFECKIMAYELGVMMNAQNNISDVMIRASNEALSPKDIVSINQQMVYFGMESISGPSMEDAAGAWETVKRVVKAIIDGIVNGAKAFFAKVSSFFTKIKTFLTGLRDSAKRALDDLRGIPEGATSEELDLPAEQAAALSSDGKVDLDLSGTKATVDSIGDFMNIASEILNEMNKLPLKADFKTLKENFAKGKNSLQKIKKIKGLRKGSGDFYESAKPAEGDLSFRISAGGENEERFWSKIKVELFSDSKAPKPTRATMPPTNVSQLARNIRNIQQTIDQLDRTVGDADKVLKPANDLVKKVQAFNTEMQSASVPPAQAAEMAQLVKDNINMIDTVRKELVAPLTDTSKLARPIRAALAVTGAQTRVLKTKNADKRGFPDKRKSS